MTELELSELLKMSNDGIDFNFQLWISSSFAVLMAFFFARGAFVNYVKWTAILLYLASSSLFPVRLIGNGLTAVGARTALGEVESEYLVYSANGSNIIGLLFVLIIASGTLATLYFCLFSEKMIGR